MFYVLKEKCFHDNPLEIRKKIIRSGKILQTMQNHNPLRKQRLDEMTDGRTIQSIIL